ncbi:MAG: hypothetical protein KF781_07750 [Chitinophagaceae bacterium]|nr:hypothetical protein [Chitinophagaceae bacterium]MCW5905649.1 hypothetical protein [Chitinophagaceae bacterium]
MNEIKLLTFEDYFAKVKELEGGHWTLDTIKLRWTYHYRVVELIKALQLKDASKVLEMGTMGVQCVKNGHTIDYAERWNFPGKQPDYLHDARKLPWPIEDKKYDLFIALRVYQHLVPVQKECVQEAMRIAKKVIIITPNYYDNNVLPDSRGITYTNFVEFLNGIHPNLYIPTELGDLYYWDTEQPSALNIEQVVSPTIKYPKNDTSESSFKDSFSRKIKRKIKRLLK